MACGRSRRARLLRANRTSDVAIVINLPHRRFNGPDERSQGPLCFTAPSRVLSTTTKPFARHGLAIAIGVASCLPSWTVSAGDIRISNSGCGKAVHLVARDVPLSEVLQRLAKVLGFELVGDAHADTPVTVDLLRHPVDLVAGLAGVENVSMTLEENPRCPGRERIAKVWVLPGNHVPPARPGAAEAEQARRDHEGIDTVLRAHGVPAAKSKR